LIDKRVSILEIVGAKDDDGDNWSYKAYNKAAVKSSPTTNQHFSLLLKIISSLVWHGK